MAPPWVFWSRVGVWATTNPGSLWACAALTAVFLHVLSALPIGIVSEMGSLGYGWGMIGDWCIENGLGGVLRALAGGLIWPFASLTRNWNVWWGNPAGMGVGLWRFCRWIGGFGLTWAMVIGVLPTTRRIATIRWEHINRALALQIIAAIYTVVLLRAGMAAAWVGPTGWTVLAELGVIGGPIVWTVVWWACAVRIGWGVRSWALMILGTIAAVLGGIVLATIELSVAYLMELR